MKSVVTFVLWAATLAVIVHFSDVVNQTGNSVVMEVTRTREAFQKEIAQAKVDMQAFNDQMPKTAEKAGRAASSGALEGIVKPLTLGMISPTAIGERGVLGGDHSDARKVKKAVYDKPKKWLKKTFGF